MKDFDLSYKLLRCGKFISDVDIQDSKGNFIRIRVIMLDDKFYYHQMMNGEVVNLFLIN